MTAEEIQAIFFAECEESLAAAEQGLAACREGTQDSDTVNAVFRGVHSIKGGAGAFGYTALQGFTHVFETLLSDVRDGTVAITEPLTDLLLRALDTLSDHVTAARDGSEPPEDAILLAELTAAMAANAGNAAVPPAEPVATAQPAPAATPSAEPETASDDFDLDFDLDALLDDISGEIQPEAEAAVADEEITRWSMRLRPHSGAMRNGSEPLLMLREMSDLGGRCDVCDISSVPPLDSFDTGTGYLGWTFSFPADVSEASVRDIFDFVGDDCSCSMPTPTCRRCSTARWWCRLPLRPPPPQNPQLPSLRRQPRFLPASRARPRPRAVLRPQTARLRPRHPRPASRSASNWASSTS